MTQEAADHKRAKVEPATLYVVATPIGNLADITLRALDVLRQVDVVAAEDTRLTRRLLGHYGIVRKLLALHEHNEQRMAAKLAALLAQGRSIALVSDAGTPAISDPGAHAVAVLRAAGHRVVPVPGASAAVCALSAAGNASPHFLFWGFLPAAAVARRKALLALSALPYALVFYEAPHRIAAALADMALAFGAQRPVTLARELTKLFESVHTCTLGEAPAWLAADAHRVKGEFVLIVDAAPVSARETAGESLRTLEVLLRELPLKQAVKIAAELSGARKNDLYELALRRKTQGD